MNKFIAAAILTVLTFLSVQALGQDGAGDTTFSSAGNADAGRVVFFKCRACHNLNVNNPHRLGPNLDNIFGRMAGTSPGYNGYSKALKESGIVWTEKTLDEWLRDPQNFLPGNKMPFAGLRNEEERRNLIAYLRQATGNEAKP